MKPSIQLIPRRALCAALARIPLGLGAVADLPRRAGFVTILHLKSGRDTQVLHSQTESQFLQAMEHKP
jgi:hypothetical protein